MKRVKSTLKKWSSELHHPALEIQWKNWQSIKEHKLGEFADLINSSANDFFKFRAILFLVVPGYWRPGFDSKQKYSPEYKSDFNVDFTKLSAKIINFSVEIITAVLNDIHESFTQSLTDANILSLSNEDIRKTVETFNGPKSKIYILNKKDQEYFPMAYNQFGIYFLTICEELAMSLLNVVEEEQGATLFQSLFFARRPFVLSNMDFPVYIPSVLNKAGRLIEKSSRVIWVQKLGRLLFAASQEEKNEGKSEEFQFIYVSLIGIAGCSLEVPEKELKTFLEEEISFLLENTLPEDWDDPNENVFDVPFNFGFKNFHAGNDYDPVSQNLKFLAQNNSVVLGPLLERMMRGRMRIKGGSIETAKAIVLCFKDGPIHSFFTDLITSYNLRLEREVEHAKESNQLRINSENTQFKIKKQSEELLNQMKSM